MACGTQLAAGLVCRTCFTLLPADARFCTHCGDMVAHLSGHPAPPASAQPGAAHPDDAWLEDARRTETLRPVQAVPSQAVPSQAAPSQAMPSQAVPSQAAQHRAASAAETAERAVVVPQAAAVPQTAALPTDTVTVGVLPAARPFRQMLGTLKLLLPADYYEPLERRPNARNLDDVRDHLAAVLAALKTYLPMPVVMHPQPGGRAAGAMCSGVFLFVDVSGFTPLSEKLRAFGKAGAERIVQIINDMFSELVTVLLDHGGILLKFGGDALLGVFQAEDDAGMAAGALHAAQAGLAMQHVMERFSRLEVGGEIRALQVKCGVAAGRYFAAHIGSPASMAYVTTGHTVNDAENAQNQAEPGEVIFTAKARALLGDTVSFEPRGETGDYFRVVSAPPAAPGLRLFRPEEPPPGDVYAQITYLVGRLERITPYLPDELVGRIIEQPDDVRIAPDHRPVTVMFANYLGISDLIDDLGEQEPDTITYHLNRYYNAMASIVERYEGTLSRMDQYAVGDRLIIFFGAPRAHEDDPLRAALVALEMQNAMREGFSALRTGRGIYRFRQRIGINTGMLFAGNVGAADLRQEYTLMGDDINLAARLMAKGEWGKILISKRTHERVNARVETLSLGDLKMKGKAKPVATFEVLGLRAENAPTDALSAPLIGRQPQLWALANAVRALEGGRGGMVAVVGEGGLGKTRLLREWEALTSAAQPTAEGAGSIRFVRAQAQSFSESVSYWLAQQIAGALLDVTPRMSKNDILYRLWERLEALLGSDEAREAVPFLAALMNLELDGEWARLVGDLEPGVRQKQTLWAVREWATAHARETPTVLVLDDLHHSDEASLAVVNALCEATTAAPLLVALVMRPKTDNPAFRLKVDLERRYPRRFTDIELKPLTAAESADLLAALVSGAAFTADVAREILGRAGGNPFYLGEVVRSLIEGGALTRGESGWGVSGDVSAIAIPDTLQGAIMARLDRLSQNARQALQMAAVIGTRFQTTLLDAMIVEEHDLYSWLSQLESGNLILPSDIDTLDEIYAFLDELVQEVAYENLTTERREVFHRRLAERLETALHESGRLEAESELLAYHFSRSDDRVKAFTYLEMAARRAQAGYANETALRDYTDAIALLDHPALSTLATWQRRFDLLFSRQAVFAVLNRHDERLADLDTLHALAAAHGDENQRADVLSAMADAHQWLGQYDRAIALATEALGIETAMGDVNGQASALHQLGVIDYVRGRYNEAEPRLTEAVRLRAQVGQAAGQAWSTMYLGMIAYAHGVYHHALERHTEALRLAEARGDMFQVGIHLTNLARVYLRLGDYTHALEEFQRSLEMKRRVGDRIGQGFSLFSIGQTYLALDRIDDARTAFNGALELRQSIDDERGISHAWMGLGMTALAEKRYAEAVEHLEKAVAISERLSTRADQIAHLSALGQAYLGAGDARAGDVSARAMVLLLEQVDVQEEQQIYLNHYRVLAAAHDPGARAYLQLALDEIAKQTARMDDTATRAKFLKQGRVNQEILAEARAVGFETDALEKAMIDGAGQAHA
jgi:class 3 adenylate cyclase/predicted ATPase